MFDGNNDVGKKHRFMFDGINDIGKNIDSCLMEIMMLEKT